MKTVYLEVSCDDEVSVIGLMKGIGEVNPGTVHQVHEMKPTGFGHIVRAPTAITFSDIGRIQQEG